MRREPAQKKPTYLWGAAAITQAITFSTPLILHIHNDTFGERISTQTQPPGNEVRAITSH
jgi:hypothetical protein